MDAKPTESNLADGDIQNRDTPNPSFTPDVDGLYIFRLIVNDAEENSLPDFVEIHAKTPNVPPNANAGHDFTIYLEETALLDGSASNDPDNSPQGLSYQWQFVSLPTGSILTNGNISEADTAYPSFTPDIDGTYVLELRVTDGQDYAYDNVAVTVEPEPIEPVQTIFDLSASAKSGKVQIVWSPVGGAACYNVYRSTTKGGPYALIVPCHETTYCTYLDFNVVNGTIYYYVVTSLAGGNESLNSNEAIGKPTSRIRR